MSELPKSISDDFKLGLKVFFSLIALILGFGFLSSFFEDAFLSKDEKLNKIEQQNFEHKARMNAEQAARIAAAMTPTPTPEPTPNIYVDFHGKVWGDTEALYITNTDDFDWVKPDIRINYGLLDKGYYLSYDQIKELHHIRHGQTVKISWQCFANEDGQRFNFMTTRPNNFILMAHATTGPQDKGALAVSF